MARSMASLQEFPSLPPCAPLAFLSRPKSPITIHEKRALRFFILTFHGFFSFLNKYRDGLRTILAPLHFTQYINRPQNSRVFFLKIGKEIGKTWRKSVAREAREPHTPVGRVFSLVPDLLFDCWRVLEDAKIRTVLQSIT